MLPKKVDWELVDRMLEAGCLGTEIAAHLQMDKTVLYKKCKMEKGKNWQEYCHEKKARGDGKIRIKQFNLCMNGDKTMLIWLGKQRLGQRDRCKEEIEFNGSLVEVLQLLRGYKKDKEEEAKKRYDSDEEEYEE